MYKIMMKIYQDPFDHDQSARFFEKNKDFLYYDI